MDFITLALGGGLLYLIFKGASGKDEPPPGVNEYLPGTTTLKSRVRVIDTTTPTPSQFAAKYSGTASRWREIVAANPVGTIFPASPAIRVVDILKAPEGGAEGPPTKVGEGLSPWNLGQLVKLPDTWVDGK